MEDSTADPALAPESTTDESRVNLESAEPFSTTSIKSEQLASEERPNCTQPNLSPKELEENVRCEKHLKHSALLFLFLKLQGLSYISNCARIY